jgi:hypothetical protein
MGGAVYVLVVTLLTVSLILITWYLRRDITREAISSRNTAE